MKRLTTSPLNRRQLLKWIGGGAAMTPFMGLVACGGSNLEESPASISQAEDLSEVLNKTLDWASGGTSSMTVDFPNSSLFDFASVCDITVTPNLTEGPCYFEGNIQDDISEGQSGLPMQLCLQVVDSDCEPVANAEVEIWHCDIRGIYSGDTNGSGDAARFAGSFCTDNDTQATASKWFRGTLLTDAEGRINCRTCFPGWYSGRTIHIHFRVKQDGSDSVISQLCFPDVLCDDICTTQSEYSGRGVQNTPLAGGRDTVFTSDVDRFTLDVKQNSDGSLLGYKVIRLSS